MRKSRMGKGAVVLGILLAAAAVVAACGGGGIGSTVSKADFVARMAVAKATQDTSGGPDKPGDLTTVPTMPTTPPAAATPDTAAATTPPATKPASGAAHAGRPAPAAAPAAATATTPGTGVSGAPPVNGSPAPGPAAAPRRQPSAAEVAQAVTAVHKLVPFFTPSASDIADVGNKVCTAFDQGASFSQVTSKALDMVGAGSYSWLIPSSVPASAVRTVVNLYCPAYAAKLV